MSEAKEVPINSIGETFTSSLFISCIKLFNAVPTKNQKKRNPSQSLVKDTIEHGFIFSPQLAGNFTDKQLRDMINPISKYFLLRDIRYLKAQIELMEQQLPSLKRQLQEKLDIARLHNLE